MTSARLNTPDMMEEELDVIRPSKELREMPLSEVSFETLDEIHRGLKFTVGKIEETTHLMANTQGLIDFLGFNKNRDFVNHTSAFAHLIDLWQNTPNHMHPPSPSKLIEILYIFERYDILYNITDLMSEDLKHWKEKKSSFEREAEGMTKPEALPDPIQPYAEVTCPPPNEDVYDAIFSYDSNNEYCVFTMEEMFRRLSTMYGLKLCRKIDAPDLERSEMMKMISKKCRHVIVLLSKSYIESEECHTVLYYSCNKDPMAQRRKIIPVLIENIETPDILLDRVTVKYFQRERRRDCLESIYKAIMSSRPR